MPRDRTDALDRIAEAITDETPVDWDAEQTAHPELAARLAGLRLVERIAGVHRAASPADETGLAALAETPIFQWGHLLVLEKIGEGSFGAVYRAYDPRLRSDVALKLLHEELGERLLTTNRFLDEARRMARVRHPNILVIHGADEHDGRPGFWTDLIDGETLEARLAADERLGVGEASVIGIELCRALSAVHGAGLVHGDVKAANVMRDGRGRIVLMDFGAGSEWRAGVPGAGGAVLGTPLSLAPELVAGASPSPAADIYALGVLLYRLVSGRYPVTAGSVEELARKLGTGESLPLLDVRPDVPAGFAEVVGRALSPAPERRFESAGAMSEALAASIRAVPGAAEELARSSGARQPRRALTTAIAAVAVAVIALLIWAPWRVRDGAERPGIVPAARRAAPPPGDVALAALEVEATLYRSLGGAREALAAGALVRPGDTLLMEIRTSSAAHVYVLNEDEQGDLFVLFPLAGMDPGNPLPPDAWHRLPGSRGGVAQNWQVTGGNGRETFLVIASRTPLEDLEQELGRLTPASPDRPVRYPPLDPSILLDSRGVSGVVPADPGAEGDAGSALAAIARRLTETASDPGGLWIRQFVVYNSGI